MSTHSHTRDDREHRDADVSDLSRSGSGESGVLGILRWRLRHLHGHETVCGDANLSSRKRVQRLHGASRRRLIVKHKDGKVQILEYVRGV